MYVFLYCIFVAVVNGVNGDGGVENGVASMAKTGAYGELHVVVAAVARAI